MQIDYKPQKKSLTTNLQGHGGRIDGLIARRSIIPTFGNVGSAGRRTGENCDYAAVRPSARRD
jgi:hypothetical protein